MQRGAFYEMFSYYKRVLDQSNLYDNFMWENFGEARDADCFNWYEREAYYHIKNIFEQYYNDDEDDFFDYFVIEREMGKNNLGEVRCKNGKAYDFLSIESFYEFCENELEQR